MATKTSTLAINLIDGISKPAKSAAAGIKQIEAATQGLAKVRGFREHTAKLEEMIQAHQRARETVKGLAAALISAEAPSNKMKAAYERATAAADKLGNRIEWQKARVRGAANAIEQMGHSVSQLGAAENRIRADIDRTTAAIRRQEAAAVRAAERRRAIGTILSGAGVVTAHRGVEIGKKAIVSAAEFDIGLRRQRAYAGISAAEQQRLLIPQAKRIGQDTQFSNLDIVEAQTAIMQRLPEQLPRAAVAQAITEEVKNYALSMRADMKTSAEGITAFLMQTGKDISTQDKAIAEARRASNMLIRMAKIGGLSDEDVSQFMKYAATSATLAGFSNETMGALGVGLKRAGFRGDEAGVAIRSISSKLVAPGRKGMNALTAMGIDYNKFTTMPGGLSSEALEEMQNRQFGKTFSDSQRKRLTEVMSDEDVVGDKNEFIKQVSAIVSESFAKTKSGKTKPQDDQKIAKLVGDFHQLGIKSVNAEGLLEAILGASPTLQQLNELFTNKQGGKAGALAQVLEQLKTDRETLRNTPGDFGKNIADEIMGGLGGSFERLKGSVENFYLALGQANEGLLKFSFDNVGNAIDAISNLTGPARQAGTALGALATAGLGAWGTLRLARMLLGMGGPGAALTGSAAALTASAAALDAAAVALAGGKVAQAVTGGVGGAAVAGGTGAAGGIISTLRAAPKVPLMVGLGLAGYGIYKIGEGNQKLYGDVEPGQPHNEGRRRQRRAGELLRLETEAIRQEVEKISAVGDGAGQRLGSGVATGITSSSASVEAAASTVMSRLKTLFGVGVDVPVRVQGSASPASGPAAVTPGGGTPAANKQSSIGTINIRVKTGEGDPNKIAQAITQRLGEALAAGERGSFSDYS